MQKHLTPQEAYSLLKEKGIEIKPNTLYNIYECGCVFLDKEEIPHFNYYKIKGKSRRKRTCPEHHKPIIGKFKQCKCGAIFFHMRVRLGEGCQFCRNKRKKSTYVRVGRKKNKSRKKYNNIHLRDTERTDCKFRNKCLRKYVKYSALPCKDCKHYWGEGVSEDLKRQGYRGWTKSSDFEIYEISSEE